MAQKILQILKKKKKKKNRTVLAKCCVCWCVPGHVACSGAHVGFRFASATPIDCVGSGGRFTVALPSHSSRPTFASPLIMSYQVGPRLAVRCFGLGLGLGLGATSF